MKKVLLLGAVVMSCAASAAETQSADERLRAIYTEEWKWRLGEVAVKGKQIPTEIFALLGCEDGKREECGAWR